MSVEIVSRYDGKVLYRAKGAADIRAALEEAALRNADLRYANLRNADLGNANLRNANLGYANLRDANLGYANLRDANLGYANLRDANLGYANLAYAILGDAKGIHPARVTDLLMLRDQVGKIRAYKLVTAGGHGPFNGGIEYTVGKTVECDDANIDPDAHCGAGINLATLPWCLANWREGFRVLLCEFTAKDIACIPTATDGKFRVHRCKVIREVDLEPIFAAERETAPTDTGGKDDAESG